MWAAVASARERRVGLKGAGTKKALILDGSGPEDRVVSVVGPELATGLRGRGWEPEVVPLRALDIAPCTGCFRCWTKTPGVCVTDDAGRELARRAAQCDLLVLLTPVTFGGYSAELKKALDRLLGNLLPFFVTIGGDTRHEPRYAHPPALLGVGVGDPTDAEAGSVFRDLVRRNAVNFHARAVAAGVVGTGGGEGTRAALVDLLAGLQEEMVSPSGARPVVTGRLFAGLPRSADLPADISASPPSPVEPPAAHSAGTPGPSPGRVVLLVGSPRPRRSTSASLGRYLLARLTSAGMPGESLSLCAALGMTPGAALPSAQDEAEGAASLLAAVQRAALVVLSTPLYVDSLPAPVVRALELLAPGGVGGRRFVALVNSGFPEARQCDAALAICRRFARETGMVWAGGLALGGGAAIDGRSLVEAGGAARGARAALDLAAEALARGKGVPAEAAALMAKPPIPVWMYRWLGNRGFRRLAARYGTKRNLRARPYAR